jgi:hypothetical protein
MSGENHPLFGVPHTEEWKQAMSGENNPMYGRTGEKSPQYGRTGALHHNSKAVITIKPDDTELHFGSGREASRELGIDQGDLSRYLKSGEQPKWGKFKGWQFFYKNSEKL